MRLSVVTIAGIFLGGWICGSLFVMTILSFNDEYMGQARGGSSALNNLKLVPVPGHPMAFAEPFIALQNSSLSAIVKQDYQEVHNIAAAAINRGSLSLRGSYTGLTNMFHRPSAMPGYEVNEIPKFAIPHPPHIISQSSLSDAVWVIMDWPVSDRLFTLENFKSLETLLNVHPTAHVRCMLPSTDDSLALSTKLPNALSIYHFIKYKRRSYDVLTIPVGSSLRRGSLSHIGNYYWENYGLSPQQSNAGRTQPFHLLMFIRLSKLYQTGGIFSDFSFLFLGPMDKSVIKTGCYFRTVCNSMDLLEEWQIAEDNTLRQQQQETVAINSDLRNQSTTLNSTNPAPYYSAKRHKQRCTTSTLMVFHQPSSEVVLCVLKMYDSNDFLSCVEDDRRFEGAKCIQQAFSACFAASKHVNELSEDHASNILEDFGGKPYNASNTLLSRSWRIAKHKRVLWLGNLAFTGHWTQLPYVNGTMMSLVDRSIVLRNVAGLSRIDGHPAADIITDRSSGHKNSCALYSTSIVDSAHHSSQYTGIEEASCSPSIVVPGFLRSDATYFYSLLSSHPQVLPPLRGYGLTQSELSPADKKYRSGCYSTNTAERMWCFPYVAPNEPFSVIADGAVEYTTDAQIPELLHKDNSRMRAIFVVRRPVDRMYRHYQALKKQLPAAVLHNISFEQLVYRGMQQESPFSQLRTAVIDSQRTSTSASTVDNHHSSQDGEIRTSAIESIMKAHAAWPTSLLSAQNSLFNESLSWEDFFVNTLFQHSIYLVAVLKYQQIFGRDRVLVVDADTLEDPLRLPSVMERVFDFLELAPFNMTSEVLDTRPFAAQLKQFELSGFEGNNAKVSDFEHPVELAVVYCHAINYFAPFNDVLSSLALLDGTSTADLSSWNHCPYASSPLDDKNATTTNDRLHQSLMWFEAVPLDSSKKKGIMAHLLPKKTSSEDTRFNTTLGMLISF